MLPVFQRAYTQLCDSNLINGVEHPPHSIATQRDGSFVVYAVLIRRSIQGWALDVRDFAP
jgi:hypothetical protein